VRAAPHAEPTGVFFEEQSAESIAQAVRAFERVEGALTVANCRASAERFSGDLFRAQIAAYVAQARR
jgi:hypothetical protein